MQKLVKVAPSILSADFANIKDSISLIEQSKADIIHCDVMDGMFVPNISFGSKMIKDIRQRTSMILDVHMMVVDPIRYIENFAQSGADIISVHIEAAADNIVDTLRGIRQLGKKAGIAISPNTDVHSVKDLLDVCDMVLLMSVYPGFGGQTFLDTSLDRLRELRTLVGSAIDIEVDGGITVDNVQSVVDSGANIIVAGSTFFGASDKASTVNKLRGQSV